MVLPAILFATYVTLLVGAIWFAVTVLRRLSALVKLNEQLLEATMKSRDHAEHA